MNTSSSYTNDVEAAIIRTLLYFDIFNYPLTQDEILRFHPEAHDTHSIIETISHLKNNLIIYKHDQFYSLQSDSSSCERRKKGNALAKKRLYTAQRYSRVIAAFPFVKGILLSGSISKDYMDPSSDIDYFIITAPKRLWLTRALLALFKRIFLFNSKKYFCTNYLIDSDSLEIEEKNFYTAIESTTLIPVYGKSLCEKFMQQNSWTKQMLPNMLQQRNAYIEERKNLVKLILERFFSGTLGEKLDLLFMKLAMNRWKKQFGKSFNQEDFNLAFKSRRNVSKNHPRFFQKHVLVLFKERIEQFEISNKIKLSA